MQPDTDAMAPLNLGELDLTTNEFILDEVDSKTFSIIVFWIKYWSYHKVKLDHNQIVI